MELKLPRKLDYEILPKGGKIYIFQVFQSYPKYIILSVYALGIFLGLTKKVFFFIDCISKKYIIYS